MISSFRLRGGVCAYVRNNLSCTRIPYLETGKKDILWLKLSFRTASKFICCVYRSPSDNTYNELFDFLSEKADHIISEHPTAEIIILGDFNVHNKEWLGSTRTDPQGRAAETFAVSNSLTNLIKEPTYFPRIATNNPSPLDLFLTSHPEPYQAAVAAPLGNSDHDLITVSCPIETTSEEILPPRTFCHYNNADWDGIREFYSSFPWNDVCFSLQNPSEISNGITEVIQVGIETFIPHTKKGAQRRNHKPWFSKACNKARCEKLKAHKKLLHNPT
jgi:hypothetical protein